VSRRYVWRVTATYPAGRTLPSWTTVRHFQSLAAARHRKAVLLGTVSPADPEVARLPRAESVTIERSAPVDGWTVTS
jgi:hypothetical protein